MRHRPLRLGLIAAAKITEPAVVEPSRGLASVELAAIAARSVERARDAAERWRIPRAHDGYVDLIEDPDIDAVYVATPASHHRPWVLAALEAGKHVLCEKPLVANADEAEEISAAVTGSDLIVMEAFHWRYHPIVDQIRATLDSGVIGSLTRVVGVANLPASFFPAGDIRWNLALGGGCLMDVGCYPLHWIRWLVGAEPEVVRAEARCRTAEVDESFRAELTWSSGITGSIECSMVSPLPEREVLLRAIGNRGQMTVYNPVLPQLGSSLVVETEDGTDVLDVDRSTTYDHQLRAFVEATDTGVDPPTAVANAVANMRLVDACYRAAGLSPRPSAADR